MANEFVKVTDQNGVDHPVKDNAAFPRSEQAVLGAVNFFVPFASDSKSGMTFTVDSNGVVDVDGLPSANYVNIKSVFTLKKGTYTVSGVPSGFGTSKMLIALYDMNNVQIAVDDGSGATFTLNADTQLQGYIYVYQAYGDFDHVKVYPMINLGTVVRAFVPFAMTNKELTDAVTLIDDASKITFAEGVASYGASYFSFDNVGNLNVISGLINGVVANADTWVTIGSIASGFRPKRTYFGFAGIVSTSEVVELQIYSDGNIAFRRNGGPIVATNNIRIFAVYAS